MNVAAKPALDARRRAMIAKVKIAQKELGLDDETYRAVLVRVTRQSSASACSEAQLALVLDEFKAKGWKPSAAPRTGTAPVLVADNKQTGAPRRGSRPADHAVAKKARALWISLHQLGEVRDPSEAALEAFARKQLKVERLQWADQAQGYKLIEALKAMAERAGWSQDLAGIDSALHVFVLKRRLLAAICAKTNAVVPECSFDQLDTWITLAAGRLKDSGVRS